MGLAPEFSRWAGLECARADVPMSHGVDRRDRSMQIQATAEELFADAVGADATPMSTNGSSMSVRVALMAAPTRS